MNRISPFALWMLLALVIGATSCSTYSARTTDSPKADDPDLAAVLVECRHEFSALKSRLGLFHYPEHIMEGGSIEVATYRYDLGQRFLFVAVNNRTGLVVGAFYVSKSRGAG